MALFPLSKMVCPVLAAVLALLVSKTSAHYMFSHLIVNKTITPEWKYVRDVAPDPIYQNSGNDLGKMAPQYDIHSPDLTCGRSAFDAAAKTETADIVAGEEVGFKVSEARNSGREFSAEIFHPGPAQIYLAKADTELEEFSGIGEEANWFKIASIVGVSDTEWATLRQNSVNFTIPETTPPAKYLLRIEQFMPSASFNDTQWYVNCAHVNIIGSGGGSLEGYNYAKFPGTYDIMDPGLWVAYEMADASPKGLSKYVAPGPAVWKG